MGDAGPRRLLVEVGEAGEVGEEGRGWRYVGPPGDARRLEGVALDSVGDNVEAGRGERRGWPYDLLGSDMQSKDAGLKGLASLVEAAGGESSG
jgi:hypothetical protein